MRTTLQGATVLAAFLGASQAGAQTLRGTWTQNNSSVKIQLTQFPSNTADFRVCADLTWTGTCAGAGGTVKYAGRQPGNGQIDTTNKPNPEVEWQFSDSGLHAIYVEAVTGSLGPTPQGSLIDYAGDTLLYASTTCTAMPVPIAGVDYGCTSTGDVIAVNGQGDYGASPTQILNAWVQIPVQVGGAPSVVPLPGQGVSDDIQVVYDSFDSSENLPSLAYQVGQQYQLSNYLGQPNNPLMLPPMDGTNTNAQWGITNYTVNGQVVPWDIVYSLANADTGLGTGTIPSNPTNPAQPVSFTRPFFRNNGFDDVLLSGDTAAWEDWRYDAKGAAWDEQREEKYASMALTPKVAADLTGNKMLHVTFEVDAQFFQGNRWASVVIAPANDPVASFRFDDMVPSTSLSGITQFGLQAANAAHNSTNPLINSNNQGLNNSNQALWVQFLQLGCDAALFSGPNNDVVGSPNEIAAGGVNFITEDFASDLSSPVSVGSKWVPPGGCTPGQQISPGVGCCPPSAYWVDDTQVPGMPTASYGCYPQAFAGFPGYFQSSGTGVWPWPKPTMTTTKLTGGYYSAPTWTGLPANSTSCSRAAGTNASVGNGRGLDDRSRFDVFLSAGNAATNTAAHLWIFEDGTYLVDSPVWQGGLQGSQVPLPFNQAKVYFVHYAYAINDNVEALNLPGAAGEPQPGLTGALGPNAYWQAIAPGTGCTDIGQACTANSQCCSDLCTKGACAETALSHGEPLSKVSGVGQRGSFPYSDHRHWDNLGFEVLPTHWSTAAVSQLSATCTPTTSKTCTYATLQSLIGAPCGPSQACPTGQACSGTANGVCTVENSFASIN